MRLLDVLAHELAVEIRAQGVVHKLMGLRCVRLEQRDAKVETNLGLVLARAVLEHHVVVPSNHD